MAGASACAWPLAARLPGSHDAPRPSAQHESFGPALREWAFWRYALSFGACGLHIAFLGERCGFAPSLAGPWIAIAGGANIAGSLLIGIMLRRWPTAAVLTAVYLGGALAQRTGNDLAFWCIDIALAMLAATLVLPAWEAKEARPQPRLRTAP
jgi:predicted MFS family arabinose efflux permease